LRGHDQTPAERGERRFELFEADRVIAVEDMGNLLRGPAEPLGQLSRAAVTSFRDTLAELR
jgi:hypothetical protein